METQSHSQARLELVTGRLEAALLGSAPPATLALGQTNAGFADTTAAASECTRVCPAPTPSPRAAAQPTRRCAEPLSEQDLWAEISSLILIIFHFIENPKNSISLNVGSNIKVWKSNFSFLFLISL